MSVVRFITRHLVVIVALGSASVKFALILVIDLHLSGFHRPKSGFGNPWRAQEAGAKSQRIEPVAKNPLDPLTTRRQATKGCTLIAASTAIKAPDN